MIQHHPVKLLDDIRMYLYILQLLVHGGFLDFFDDNISPLYLSYLS